jgi:hypothetical protein
LAVCVLARPALWHGGCRIPPLASRTSPEANGHPIRRTLGLWLLPQTSETSGSRILIGRPYLASQLPWAASWARPSRRHSPQPVGTRSPDPLGCRTVSSTSTVKVRSPVDPLPRRRPTGTWTSPAGWSPGRGGAPRPSHPQGPPWGLISPGPGRLTRTGGSGVPGILGGPAVR